jgi:hypothetical protein
MNTNHYEDLTRINGIGESRQRLLREQLQVRTMRDLAALNVDEIAQVLKQQRTPISPEQIETWLEEARAFARGETPALTDLSVTTLPPPAAEWQPVASFVIEIQTLRNADGSLTTRTMMSHVESDNNAHWEGFLPQAAQAWLRAQTGLPDEAPAVSAAGVPVMTAPPMPEVAARPASAMFMLERKPSGKSGTLVTPFATTPPASPAAPATSGKPLYFGAEAQQQLERIGGRYGR